MAVPILLTREQTLALIQCLKIVTELNLTAFIRHNDVCWPDRARLTELLDTFENECVKMRQGIFGDEHEA